MTDATTQAAPAKSKIEIATEKLIAAQEVVRLRQAELDSLTKYSNLAVGGLIGFEFGRGDKKANLQGEVQATGKLDNGVDVVVVLVGKGTINAELKRVPISTVNAYTPPVKAEPVDLVAETQAAQAAEAAAADVKEPVEPVSHDDALAAIEAA